MKPLTCCLLIALALSAATVFGASPEDAYGFLYWAHGWRDRSPDGARLLIVQTSHYAAEWDVESAQLTGLGPVLAPLPYDVAVSGPAVTPLPEASLTLAVESGGRVYRCTGADLTSLTELESPSRIIAAGRNVQRFDIQKLVFECGEGERLAASGRLEVVAWPDRLHLMLELTPEDAFSDGELRMALDTGTWEDVAAVPLAGSADVSVMLVWPPESDAECLESVCEVVVLDLADNKHPLPVVHDGQRGWFHVALPVKDFSVAQEADREDRYRLRLTNRGKRRIQAPLLFALEGNVPGITGMTPMLLDVKGRPTGIPVQISKNWHSKPEAPELYDGVWFHGFAYVSMPPESHWEGEFRIVYAHWGGVPAVSHAQLCLIGWGVNQLWDQVAIGSWGETICYDPDINLNRSMIDDIRPLMVHGMGSTPDRPILWNWTNNVGGGDFLTWFDASGARRYPQGMRTAYLRYGPNLTEVVYAGMMGDGAVSLRVTASSPRCDDVARAYHHLRYDVLRPAPFSRLAFYQLGADNYNDHQFKTLAMGNRDGLIEEWGFELGGLDYDRAGVALDGDGPWWFSMHDAVPRAPRGGAWANRGLIIRSWEARLGGKAVSRPHAAFFGTENGYPSMNVELAPPAGLDRLEPGDYVEALVEVVVVPMDANDYYGPNQNLRADLEQHANTWRPVYRLARKNDIEVTVERGTCLRSYPILIACDERQEALFFITGGAGHVPLTISGLKNPFSGTLMYVENDGDAEEVAVHLENVYRQVARTPRTGAYEATFNLNLDAPGDAPRTIQYRFMSKPCGKDDYAARLSP